MKSILFHATTAERAEAILRDGFVDGRGNYTAEIELSGVWLFDFPLDANVSAWGDAVLAVSFVLPLSCLAEFEVIEDAKPYREWCVPSDFIRQHATVAFVPYFSTDQHGGAATSHVIKTGSTPAKEDHITCSSTAST